MPTDSCCWTWWPLSCHDLRNASNTPPGGAFEANVTTARRQEGHRAADGRDEELPRPIENGPYVKENVTVCTCLVLHFCIKCANDIFNSRDKVKELSELQLVALVQNQAVVSAELVPGPKGWVIRINRDQVLRSARESVRTFARTDTALRYLREIGVTRAAVDLAGWPIEKLRARGD